MNRIIITAVLIILLALPADVKSQAVVSITPSSQTVGLPHNASITVEISGVTGLYGFQFDISNDTTYWRFDKITVGDFLSESGLVSLSCFGPDTSLSNIISNYACTRLQAPSGVSGSGVLAKINLTTNLQAGTTQLSLTNVKLSDINSLPISYTLNHATVTSQWCTSGTFQDCRVDNEPRNETGECEYGGEECIGGMWSGICDSPPPVFSTAEECDDLDNDCDGVTDNGCDDDGDGYCDSSMTLVGSPAVCPNGGGDCVDTDINIYPGATEICDNANNDCDASIDEGCDDDNDDYCDDTMVRASPYSCSGGAWCCPNVGGDCNDTNINIYPGATEICDDLNNDCDASIDEGCDDDNDDYCDDTMSIVGTPSVCLSGGGDCDDDPGQCGDSCNPGNALDICPYTAYDEDCDGVEEYMGDADCNGCVEIYDLSTVGMNFGEISSDPDWDPSADLISDNEIDIFDLVAVGSNYGNAYDGATC